MMTDEERREVAKGLRDGNLAEGIGDDGVVLTPEEAGFLLLRVLDVINDYRDGLHYLPSHFSAEAAVGLLADLIDHPTCRNVHDGREFECSNCGMHWHMLDRADGLEEWAHVRKPGYCPNCGARVVE